LDSVSGCDPTRARSGRDSFSLRSRRIRCAVFLPIPGTLEIAATSSVTSARRNDSTENAEHPRHRDEGLEHPLLGLRGETVEGERVLANVEVRPQPGSAALGGEGGQRRSRAAEPVADAVHIEEAAVGVAPGDRPAEEADHAFAASMARASPLRLMWQIASAHASAASGGLGGAARPSTAATIAWT
jgi:hypothetical protein